MSRLPPPPATPRPPARTPFPVIAVIAPIVGALAIGAIVRSPFVLVFAVLSPLIAIATVLDARRQARAHRRAEATRFDRECGAYEVAISHAHRAESAAAWAAPEAARHDNRGPTRVRVGSAPGRSSVVGDVTAPLGDDDAERRVAALLARASVNPRLPLSVPAGTVTVVGRGLAADAVARRLGAERGVEVRRSESNGDAGPRDGAVVLVRSATRIQVQSEERLVDGRPEFDSAGLLSVENALEATESALPSFVAWSTIAHEGRGLAVPIGRDEVGILTLDLAGSGPHAIVGGTTGSGKSELLRALALGWAAAAPPEQVQLLFVDFKGGATFAGLTRLPHSAGLVTDLDSAGASRVMQSLRAEVRRRERVLAEHGVRDIRDNPDVAPRLLVLIDEYAALLEAHSELAPLMSDLAARGRSLGVHLVLCTQVPGATVRDAVAANCPVRVSFRVTEPSAASFLGRSAPELLGAPPGRALIVGAAQVVGAAQARQDVPRSAADEPDLVQVACVADADIETVCARWQGSPRPDPPWLPPLPTSLDRQLMLSTLAIDAEHPDRTESVVFGVVDLPDEQRRAPACWLPRRDGPLAVVGAARSGKSTALAALATSSRDLHLEPVVLPQDVPDAWALLEELGGEGQKVLLLADDLDALVTRAREASADFLERWDDAVAAVLHAGGAAAVSLSPGSATRGHLAARFTSRLLLRTADADEHALLGGPRGGYDRSAPAGRGWWAGHAVHVVTEPASSLVGRVVIPPAWQPSDTADTVIICRRPTRVGAVLAAEHPELTVCTDLHTAAHAVTPGEVAIRPRALVGTPGEWSAVWTQLNLLRARSDIVVIDVPASETRAMLGLRGALPPLDVSRGDVWHFAPGEPPQRRRWTAIAAASGGGTDADAAA